MVEREITIRRAEPSDRAEVLQLCRSSLGWSPKDPDEAFFSWKHDENPFGRSPAWIAVAPDSTVVGLRVFLRWRFRTGSGETVTAVRAVDTATHPDWRGLGIFSKLTLGALPELLDERVGAVFNTPNDKSMPGYLKMGWSTVGKVPVSVRLGSVRSLPRLANARTAAELWSEPVSVGVAAVEAFADADAVELLLQRRAPTAGLGTDRTTDFLQWRYRFEPLHYRVLPLGDSVGDGIIVFRARRRGGALEATICDVIAPRRARVGAAFREIARAVDADYLLAGSASARLTHGFVPAARLGPSLTWRPIERPTVPGMSELDLTLGDIELF